MARMEFKGGKEMEVALYNAESKMPMLIPHMLQEASRLVLFELQMANDKFQKYWKAKKPKHNQWGWFVAINLKGKTSSGAPVALAANVNEFGRQGYHPQPARPFVRRTLEEIEPAVENVMQTAFDKGMKEIMHV
jgi:hypothetical protein